MRAVTSLFMEQPDGDTGDPLLFEFSSEPLTPAGTAPFRQPTFFETDVLLGLIKSGLVSSWEQLRAEQRDTCLLYTSDAADE